MRPHIRLALELALALARLGRLIDALQIGSAAIDAATRDEQPAVGRWLDEHINDFARKNG
ncbi:hypothetical protein ACFY0R_23870 [Streptomyces sp. NPDC001633]|uniref:hypothetical protein n=1 Tax=Streptomyces sp. NPDC001633 TaxID=3364595 RepID=UPI0036B323D0